MSVTFQTPLPLLIAEPGCGCRFVAGPGLTSALPLPDLVRPKRERRGGRHHLIWWLVFRESSSLVAARSGVSVTPSAVTTRAWLLRQEGRGRALTTVVLTRSGAIPPSKSWVT